MVSLNRVVMNKSSSAWFKELPLEKMELAEISGKWGRRFEAKSYERFKYPEHDICLGPYTDAPGKMRQFDMILAIRSGSTLIAPLPRFVMSMTCCGTVAISGSRSRFFSPITRLPMIALAGPHVASKTC